MSAANAAGITTDVEGRVAEAWKQEDSCDAVSLLGLYIATGLVKENQRLQATVQELMAMKPAAPLIIDQSLVINDKLRVKP